MPLTKRPKVTPRKIAANRANAKKSTGPCTQAGKQRTRFNALTHGATARELKATMSWMGETPGQYDRLREGFLASLPPANVLESYLLENMAETAWRQERLIRSQYAMQAHSVKQYTVYKNDPVERDRSLSANANWEQTIRLEGQLSRHFERQFKMLMRLRAARDDEPSAENIAENCAENGSSGVEEYSPARNIGQDFTAEEETGRASKPGEASDDIPSQEPDGPMEAVGGEEQVGGEEGGSREPSPVVEQAPAESLPCSPLTTPEENSPNRTHDVPENTREDMLVELIGLMEENLKMARAADENAPNSSTECGRRL